MADKEVRDTIKNKRAEATRIMSKEQFKKCSLLIHSTSFAAGAVAFIPVPVVDALPISAAQIAMVVSLGKIFDQKLSDSAAKAIIGSAASTLIGRSAVKLIPVIGSGVSAGVAGLITEAIGWTAAVDFARHPKEDEFSFPTDKPAISLDEFSDTIEAGEEYTQTREEFEESGSEQAPEDSQEQEVRQVKGMEPDEKNRSSDDESLSNDFSDWFKEDDEL